MIFPFNEISLNELGHHSDIEKFYIQIEELVKLLSLEKLPNIVFKSDFVSLDINGIGNIHDIIKNSDLKDDEERALLSIIQNTPYIDEEVVQSHQITYCNEEAHGFAYAYNKDIASISIPSDTWNGFSINVNKITISDTCEIEEEPVTIKHLGELKNFQGSWLEEFVVTPTYSNQEEFIEYFNEKYPHITVLEACLASIRSLNMSKIRRLDRSLEILNEYCSTKWKVGKLRYSTISELGLYVRPESDSTLQQYGEQRMFLNESGDRELFSLHFDISEGERAYIKGIDKEKTVFIPYIGKHLSTKKFPK